MHMELTQEAKDTLVNIGTSRQGTTVNSTTPERIIRELQGYQLIGHGYGLTRRGSIVRENIVHAALDAAFS